MTNITVALLLPKSITLIGVFKTKNSFKDLAYAMDTNESGDIDFPEFLQLMSKRIADGNLEEDINEAFKVSPVRGRGLLARP